MTTTGNYRQLAISLLAISCVALVPIATADDAAERFIREAQHRAEYWRARGYTFDPFIMSADSMDRQVENQKRAEYWAERGFQFDPKKLTAWAMDRSAEANLRAEYWRRWGIEFDADVMDAETMDDAAVKLKQVRSKLDEIRRQGGEQPAVALDAAAAKIWKTPPKVKGGKRVRSPGGLAATNAPIAIGGGLGGMGGGRSGTGAGTPGRAGAGGQATGSAGRSGRSGSGGLKIPPGVPPEEFIEFLKRLELGI